VTALFVPLGTFVDWRYVWVAKEPERSPTITVPTFHTGLMFGEPDVKRTHCAIWYPRNPPRRRGSRVHATTRVILPFFKNRPIVKSSEIGFEGYEVMTVVRCEATWGGH